MQRITTISVALLLLLALTATADAASPPKTLQPTWTLVGPSTNQTSFAGVADDTLYFTEWPSSSSAVKMHAELIRLMEREYHDNNDTTTNTKTTRLRHLLQKHQQQHHRLPRAQALAAAKRLGASSVVPYAAIYFDETTTTAPSASSMYTLSLTSSGAAASIVSSQDPSLLMCFVDNSDTQGPQPNGIVGAGGSVYDLGPLLPGSILSFIFDAANVAPRGSFQAGVALAAFMQIKFAVSAAIAYPNGFEIGVAYTGGVGPNSSLGGNGIAFSVTDVQALSSNSYMILWECGIPTTVVAPGVAIAMMSPSTGNSPSNPSGVFSLQAVDLISNDWSYGWVFDYSWANTNINEQALQLIWLKPEVTEQGITLYRWVFSWFSSAANAIGFYGNDNLFGKPTRWFFQAAGSGLPPSPQVVTVLTATRITTTLNHFALAAWGEIFLWNLNNMTNYSFVVSHAGAPVPPATLALHAAVGGELLLQLTHEGLYAVDVTSPDARLATQAWTLAPSAFGGSRFLDRNSIAIRGDLVALAANSSTGQYIVALVQVTKQSFKFIGTLAAPFTGAKLRTLRFTAVSLLVEWNTKTSETQPGDYNMHLQRISVPSFHAKAWATALQAFSSGITNFASSDLWTWLPPTGQRFNVEAAAGIVVTTDPTSLATANISLSLAGRGLIGCPNLTSLGALTTVDQPATVLRDIDMSSNQLSAGGAACESLATPIKSLPPTVTSLDLSNNTGLVAPNARVDLTFPSSGAAMRLVNFSFCPKLQGIVVLPEKQGSLQLVDLRGTGIQHLVNCGPSKKVPAYVLAPAGAICLS